MKYICSGVMWIHLLIHVSLFFSIFADSTCSHAQYYIMASEESISCHQEPCLTLSQFTSNFTHSAEGDYNVSLVFLPGNHSLNQTITIHHARSFSMVASAEQRNNGSDLVIQCISPSAKISVTNTTTVVIKGITFVGCGCNTVNQVEQFIVEDVIFQGASSGTALVLNAVTHAEILQSLFSWNAPSIISRCGATLKESSNQELPLFLGLRRDYTARAGGAIYVSFSDVLVSDCNFSHNRAGMGGALFSYRSNITIAGCTYNYNSAKYGGVIFALETLVNIVNGSFGNNMANYVGGVLLTYYSPFPVSDALFMQNNASRGGVLGVLDAPPTLSDSAIVNCSSSVNTHNRGSVIINSCTFMNNTAFEYGGVMKTTYGTISIHNSSFTGNTAYNNSGVIEAFHGSFRITNSTFTKNIAKINGGVITSLCGHFSIIRSTFTHNTANNDGGVLSTARGLLDVTGSNFTHNIAGNEGGAMTIYQSVSRVRECSFTDNRAEDAGGTIWSLGSSITVENCTVFNNTANSNGGIMFAIRCSMHVINSIFNSNAGSLFIFNSNLTVSGSTTFAKSFEPRNRAYREGGALTVFQSTVIFNGVTSFTNNRAKQGGAILAGESTIVVFGRTTIANNGIKGPRTNGGGIMLHQSEFLVKGSCTISGNYALRGGGVYAYSSAITVFDQRGTLQFVNNSAERGGGLYFEVNPKLYLLEDDPCRNRSILTFSNNKASYGGAVYVGDSTNSGGCLGKLECFIQKLALHQDSCRKLFNMDIYFSGNTATKRGQNLFGGLLDRCVPSTFGGVNGRFKEFYNGVSYLKDLSNVAVDSIASLPVGFCFCNKNEPDCSYQPPLVRVKKGETFKLSIVTVDQVNRSVEGYIVSTLDSPNGGFSEDQHIQRVGSNCTDLTFNIFSPHRNESVNIFVDGPCLDITKPSRRKQKVSFLNCTCPTGFQPRASSVKTRCECDCDSKLSPHITNCDPITSSIIREGTDSWITYTNDTNPPGYVIHPNCPFDYCKPQTSNVSVNLNLPNGADAQCAFNRTGILCGACQEHLSLSLGTSHCLHCPSYWPAVLVAILLAAIIAGILLVTALLALNMTVAVGLINGFIFYANIEAANGTIDVFTTTLMPTFPDLFISWLNLQFGLDICFINGLDTYTKIWLHLAIPVYIISLVVFIIIACKHSPRFAALIGKKDPVATLATLILLSYANLLSITITALSFAIIEYPDGSRELVWFPDGNVKYFQGKHAILAIVALLIILVGVPYTILLLLWQWIVRVPRWKVFNWTRNTKLNAFIATYHAPYTTKHRYWTGLLLLVRVVLYVVSATTSAKPYISLVATIILVGGLMLIGSLKIYEKSFTNFCETMIYFNLLVLAAFRLYDSATDSNLQTAVAYASTSLVFLLLVGAVVYHCVLLVKKEKTTEVVVDMKLAASTIADSNHSNSKNVITRSEIQLHCQPQEPAVI